LVRSAESHLKTILTKEALDSDVNQGGWVPEDSI
jgi:hypothetical protein